MGSANAVEVIEDNIDDALEAAYAEHMEAEEVVEEIAEVPEEATTEEVAEEPAEATEEVAEEVVEELLEPHQHWRQDIKETFKTMSRPQQEKWMERETGFQQAYDTKAAEANNSRDAIKEYQDIIGPLVPEWTRRGVAPSQGLRQLVQLANDLSADPKAALLRMAGDHSVDLEQAYAQQPYVDPQTRQLQQEQQQLREQLEEATRQREQDVQRQQQMAQHSAEQQLQSFINSTDESGNPKYPYVNDPMVGELMGRALSTGQAVSIEDAYSKSVEYLKGHSIYKDRVQQQSAESQKKVARAQSAGKVVSGDSASAVSTDEDAALLALLEENGFTD